MTSDEVWRTKFEEEHQRHKDHRRQYQRELQESRGKTAPTIKKLENIGEYLQVRSYRGWIDTCYDAWCMWVVDEKSRRQFGQLNDDYDGFKESRQNTVLQLSKSKEGADLRLQEHDAKAQRHLQRWASSLAIAESLLGEGAESQLLDQAFDGWRAAAAETAFTRRLVGTQCEDSLHEWTQTLFAAWRAEAGQHLVDELQERVRVAEEMEPGAARRTAAACAARALELPGGGRGADSAELLAELLLSWALVARAGARRRGHATRLMDSSLWRGLEAAALACCLAAWRGAISRAEAAVAAERVRIAGRHGLGLCKGWATSLLLAACEGTDKSGARSALQCWRFLAAHCKLQRSLEQVFAKSQDVREECNLRSGEVHTLRHEHTGQLLRWKDDRERLQEQFCSSEVSCAEAGEELKVLLEGRADLERQCSEATSRSQRLQSELAEMQTQSRKAAEQLQAIEDGCGQAEDELMQREADYEEECASAELTVQQLEQEVTKQRERRQLDVKNTRHQWRLQVARQEDAVKRMAAVHEEEEGTWAQKLERADERVAKLEQEVQLLRQGRREVPAMSSALESESAELLEQVLAAERQVEQADASERRRRAKLAELRASYEDLRSRREFLMSSRSGSSFQV